ncbi:MAG: beta-glucosidase, partial [Anaerolineales bacterium]
MTFIETFIKKLVFKAIMGELKVSNDSLAMLRTEVEDADFTGRADSHLSTAERVAVLIKDLTLEEKVRLVGGYKQLGIHPIPRVGLPSIWASDATSGLRSFPGGIAFISGVAMAATWDERLIEELGSAIGEEFRARGVSILLGPGVNIYRVPTCGRNFEYMGEDPLLAGKISAAYIRGAQSKGVLTTVKHFVANNSDFDRHKTDSVVSERTLREIYLPAFKMAVKEGGSRGVMSSYNPVNGTYASENAYLLKKILRDEWGFRGFVISDWNSVYSTVQAVKNGLNLEMPLGKWITMEKVSAAIESGDLSEDAIDQMLSPLLTALFEAGVYDRPQIDEDAKIHSPRHEELAQHAAESAVVLLKNDNNLLPLDPEKINHLVVMGRTSVNTPTGGGGSSYVHRSDSVDIIGGVEDAFPNSLVTHIPYKPGNLSPVAANLIRGSDAVVIAAGFYSYEESECFDRSWQLPDGQNILIQQVAKLNPNVVVVLTTGGGVESEGWVHQVPSVLHTFFLGEYVGKVVARIISGKANPGGKLPFTMAKRWDDFASTAHYVKRPEKVRLKNVFIGQGNPKRRKVWQMLYREELNIGYRHFDTAKISPQFAFGHGLSYTKFALEDFKVEMVKGLPVVQITVRNIGEVAGSEVVQCYVKDPESSLPRPEKELKAFKKVWLEPGVSAQIVLRLPSSAFEYYDDRVNKWVLEKVVFEIMVGNSRRYI